MRSCAGVGSSGIFTYMGAWMPVHSSLMMPHGSGLEWLRIITLVLCVI